MKKFISLLLCAVLLFSLAACGGDGDQSTPAPTSTPEATPEPTPVATPDPLETTLEAYQAASAALLAQNDLQFEINRSITRTIGGQSYEETLNEHLAYKDRLSDAPVILRDQHLTYFGQEADISYIYSDGMAFIDNKYKTEISREAFEAYIYPIALIDPALYGEMSVEGGALVLSAPTAAEAWLGDVELIDASAKVELDADGGIANMSYEAEYIQSTVNVSLSLSMSPADIDADISERLPESISILKSVPDIRVPELFTRTELAARGSGAQTITTGDVYVVEAGALYYTITCELNQWGSGEDMELVFTEDQSIIENGQQYNNSFLSEYRDGVYTSDGYEIELSPEELDMYSIVCSEIMPISDFESMSLTELDGYYLIEFEVKPTLGVSAQKDICSSLYGDGSLLDSIADDYKTTAYSGYLSVDADSLLPVGYNCEFSGVHSIYGTETVISKASSIAFDLASVTACEAVTGEAPADAEPAEKAAPLFYKVSGENGQTMWLFGTVHVGDGRTAYLPESIYEALEGSDALAVEVNVNELEELMEADPNLALELAGYLYYTDGSSIDSHIDAGLYSEAVTLLKAIGSYRSNLDLGKPYLWANTIDGAYMSHAGQLSSEKGVDMRLLKIAEEKGIEIREVESSTAQFAMMGGFSDELQELLLAASVGYERSEYSAELMELYELWCSGDEAALTDYIRADTELEFSEEDLAELSEEDIARYEALIAEYEKAMGPDRDAGMIQTAIGYLESGETVFYAVGLAHLLAETGLVDGLRAAGYTVELVK